LEPLFKPLYEALIARQQQAGCWQGDETRWLVFADQEGKVGHQWWLWVFLSDEEVVFVLDVSRSRRVPQDHLPQEAAKPGVLLVDRYASYKAILQVKKGEIRLAFCWAHVRRDFIRVGRSWPELREWALAWLRRLRDLYRLNDQRLQAMKQEAGPQVELPLRRHLDAMQQHKCGGRCRPRVA
jgi:transposase